METLEQFLSLPSKASLPLADTFQDLSLPEVDSPDMPFPNMKKRLQGFYTDSKRRHRDSQESVISSQKQQSSTPDSANTPRSSGAKDRSTVASNASQELLTEEPTRKRARIQPWLVHQAQRFDRMKHGFRKHRDSMFDQEDVEKELKLASKNANAVVQGPDGEPLDQRVIDHFFMLHQACGSGWRDSARWERHQAKCLQMQCDVCTSPWYVMRSSLSPPKTPSSQPTQSISPQSQKPLKKPTSFEDRILSIPAWRSGSQGRKDKGKSPATIETMQESSRKMIVRPQAQALTHLPERAKERNL
ncbi:hypothetical protein OPT61_g10633 [Boeremia exigua]|uniref:Uncharacterized protein n=1 Tax=Boeremia exigua TaxID=749465 RepID=A0ACC2HPI5_9PLEO|nr:hypothetical protein OPT61_g10633 [Boeremia exigua]